MTTALYRRYRPDTFEDVIGQEHVTGALETALSTSRVAHAFLFSGPRGCGKTTSARILARSLNCEKGPTPTPCGACASCIDLASGGPGSLDVIEIDAASHNGVDDARSLRERAEFAPTRDRYRIFILDEAHMVTTQGFNALLKLVEEPPEHVKFIFATTEPDKVITTIRSRTHHYPFRLVPPGVLMPYLRNICMREGVTIDESVLPLVTRAGGGSVRDSLSVLDQLIAGSEGNVTHEQAARLLGFTDSALLDRAVDALGDNDGAATFAVVEEIVEAGHEPRRFVEDLLQRLRDLIVCGLAGPARAQDILVGIPPDQLAKMLQQAAQWGTRLLSRRADMVEEALREMTGATAPRLQLELLLARLLVEQPAEGAARVAAAVAEAPGGAPAPETSRAHGSTSGSDRAPASTPPGRTAGGGGGHAPSPAVDLEPSEPSGTEDGSKQSASLPAGTDLAAEGEEQTGSLPGGPGLAVARGDEGQPASASGGVGLGVIVGGDEREPSMPDGAAPEAVDGSEPPAAPTVMREATPERIKAESDAADGGAPAAHGAENPAGLPSRGADLREVADAPTGVPDTVAHRPGVPAGMPPQSAVLGEATDDLAGQPNTSARKVNGPAGSPSQSADPREAADDSAGQPDTSVRGVEAPARAPSQSADPREAADVDRTDALGGSAEAPSESTHPGGTPGAGFTDPAGAPSNLPPPSQDDVRQKWRQLLEGMSQRSSLYTGLLGATRGVDSSQGTVRFTLAQDGYVRRFKSMGGEQDLGEVLSQIFGQPLTAEVGTAEQFADGQSRQAEAAASSPAGSPSSVSTERPDTGGLEEGSGGPAGVIPPDETGPHDASAPDDGWGGSPTTEPVEPAHAGGSNPGPGTVSRPEPTEMRSSERGGTSDPVLPVPGGSPSRSGAARPTEQMPDEVNDPRPAPAGERSTANNAQPAGRSGSAQPVEESDPDAKYRSMQAADRVLDILGGRVVDEIVEEPSPASLGVQPE